MSNVSNILPPNVYHNLKNLLPAAVLSEICCFVFYDKHPRDRQNIDVIICTKNGEVKEFYQRQVVMSMFLDVQATEIRIIRNSRCEMFYLISLDYEIFILSRRGKLAVHHKISNVETFELGDSLCKGKAYLKVIQKNNAVPLIFDDNFENLGDRAASFNGLHADEEVPILTYLKRKLIETKYTVNCNEKTLKDFTDLRQGTTFSVYQEIQCNKRDSLFKDKTDKINVGLKIKSHVPWVKVCNEKIVIVLNVANENEGCLEDVHVLLHGTTRPCIVYVTKTFSKSTPPLYWFKNDTNTIECGIETAIVTVIDLKEIKHNITSRIDFNGVIFYKMQGKECVIPFDNVHISTITTMGDEFDVLSCREIDDPYITLAILATTERTDLKLTHIRNECESPLNMLEAFCEYLNMERLANTDNIVIHRRSPYHILNGTMAVVRQIDSIDVQVTAFTRSSSQLLSLLQFIYDSMPYIIVITTDNYKKRALHEEYSNFNDNFTNIEPPKVNYEDYATSMVNQASMILEYFDRCNVKMSDTKDPVIESKIGHEIDYFALGISNYLEFKNNLLKMARDGLP